MGQSLSVVLQVSSDEQMELFPNEAMSVCE